MIHWSINGRFLTQKVTGVQRYAREIVRELDLLLQEQHPATAGLDVEILAPASADDMPELRAIPIRRAGRFHGHVWEQVSLPAEARGGIVNLCNTAPLRSRRNVLCIHDLNVRDYPASYSRKFRVLYNTLVPLAARRAVQVTTVSQHSARRLASLGLDPAAITVLPNGHEHVRHWQADASAKVQQVQGPDTVVVLGSTAPHKNIAMLLRLGPQLQKHGIRLALVGGFDASVFGGEAPVSAENIIVTGRVSDDELAALLKSCLCLAFPSLVEGFGLPPLEAMAIGCPVVSSDRASLPEVGGEAVLYADPEDPDAWLAAFLRLKEEPGLRQGLIDKGFRQAKRFSWRASALGYLRLMSQAGAIRP